MIHLHTAFILFSVLAVTTSVTASPQLWCPPGQESTVTTTVTVTETIHVPGPTVTETLPLPSPGTPTSTIISQSVHSIPPTVKPVPTHSVPRSIPVPRTTTIPVGPTPYPGSGNGNGGSAGNDGSSNGNIHRSDVCCNQKGQADSPVITAAAKVLGIDLSGKKGLVGLVCRLIGEGGSNPASSCETGALLQCGSISPLGLGSDCQQ